jgi:hypothetical protein
VGQFQPAKEGGEVMRRRIPPILMKTTNAKIQEVQHSPNKEN